MSAADRYKTIGQRDFGSAAEHLLETEFKLVGSHRVIRMIVEGVLHLHLEFDPETADLTPGTILWATTQAGDSAKVSWGKRAEEYGVHGTLPLVTKDEIVARMKPDRRGRTAAQPSQGNAAGHRNPWSVWSRALPSRAAC